MFALSKEISKSYKTEIAPKTQISNDKPKKNTTICIINDSPAIQEGILSSIHDIPEIKKLLKLRKKIISTNTPQSKLIL